MASRSLSRPIHLVLDYDGTLTIKDTMAVLAGLANDQPRMTWEEIVNAYQGDYEEYKETSFPWKKYDREEYSRWLASRKWVEERSARRVEDAEFFRGATREYLRQAVNKSIEEGSLQLRDAWLDLFDWSLTGRAGNGEGRKISILSVNWSESSIREALLQHARKLEDYPHKEALCKYIQHMEILANEIQGLDHPGGSSGRVCREDGQDIRTSDDKLHRLPRHSGGEKDTLFVIYVGDSTTDFDCLCRADLGIWMCDVPDAEYETAFKETFKPFAGSTPPPLASIDSLADCKKELFYWTPSLSPLSDLLNRSG